MGRVAFDFFKLQIHPIFYKSIFKLIFKNWSKSFLEKGVNFEADFFRKSRYFF
jgi:hypothetical protein